MFYKLANVLAYPTLSKMVGFCESLKANEPDCIDWIFPIQLNSILLKSCDNVKVFLCGEAS